MNWKPILDAPLLTRAHIAVAVFCVIIGGLQFVLKKGSSLHKALGWVWVALMAIVGISAFFMPERKQDAIPLTFLLTAWVLIGLPLAIWAIKKGNILLHRAFMMGLYLGGLFIALAFTVTPGRLLYKALFGG